MNDFNGILSIAFEVIIALILLLTAIYTFLHAKKGEDIAAVPFGVAHLVFFVAQAAAILVLMNKDLSNVSADILIYVKWHQGLSLIIYSLGVFFSVFLNGKLYSIISIPAMTFACIFLGLGFVPSFFPTFPNFAVWGWFAWTTSGSILVGASLMYFLFYIRQKERFRIIMSTAFFVLATAFFLLLAGDNPAFGIASSALRFLGFGMIFYEVQANYL